MRVGGAGYNGHLYVGNSLHYMSWMQDATHFVAYPLVLTWSSSDLFNAAAVHSACLPFCCADYFSSSRLVDETGEAQCTLFAQELERLPKIEKIGDVLRLHRVGVSDTCGVCHVGVGQ